MIRCEDRVARALSGPIFNLCRSNGRFGTGYDFKRDSNGTILLFLMDDCAKYGNCIKTLKSFSKSDNDDKFIHDIVSEFERQIFELHDPNS